MINKDFPSKRVAKTPKGEKENGKKYVEDKEEYDEENGWKNQQMWGKAADIGEAMMKAKMGYSNKPRVKPQKKVGRI